MPHRLMVAAALVLAATSTVAVGAGEAPPWRQDPVFQQIDQRLADVRAIDNHTHLLSPEQFDPKIDAMMPFGLRSTSAGITAVLVERYGLPAGTAPADGVKVARAARARMVEERGVAGYFYDHLDYTRTDIALVNQGSPEGTDGRRLISAQPILFPVPDVAANLRKYLVFAPAKVLFGTDPGNYPTVPVGPEVLHASASRAPREALSLTLAGLVRDGVVSIETAIQMGRGVLRDNARRLYGWTVP